MTAMAMTMPVERSSPVRLPRRDMVLGGRDALTLTVTLLQYDDPASPPADLTAASAYFRVWPMAGDWWNSQHDYSAPMPSSPLYSLQGFVLGDGVVSFAIPSNAMTQWGPRVSWTLDVDYGGNLSQQICAGGLHLTPSPSSLGAPPVAPDASLRPFQLNVSTMNDRFVI